MDRYLSLIQELRKVCPGLELRENELMSRHTTFRIGGPARLMALRSRRRRPRPRCAVPGTGRRPILYGQRKRPFGWRTGDTTGLS